MKQEDKDEMANLIADKLSEHKKEKSWFMKLGWFYKVVLGMSALVLAFSTIGSGTSYVLDIINHEAIQRDESERRMLFNLVKIDSTIIYDVDKNKEDLEIIKKKGVEGNKFYAVGYRAEKKEDGTIVKHYRDWNGNIYQIFPDPTYSNFNFTYWFYNNPDGTKEYTFGK